jgi:hypothetical protein
MTDGGLLHDSTQLKLDVLSAVHFITEAWIFVTPTTIRNCFVKCGFCIAVSSNDNSAVKLTEDDDDWHSLQSFWSSI